MSTIVSIRRAPRPSPVAQLLPRLLAAGIAAAALVLSARAITQVAAGEAPLEHSFVPPEVAWLVPVVVDGTVVTALAVAWLRRRGGWRTQWLPALIAVLTLALSVSVNLARVAPHLVAVDDLYTVLAVVPPLALASAIYLGFAAAWTPRAASVPGASALRRADTDNGIASDAQDTPGPADELGAQGAAGPQKDPDDRPAHARATHVDG